MKTTTIISTIVLLLTSRMMNAQSNVWFITTGNPNRDNSWGVDVDSLGNIWWATFEASSSSIYTDIYINKIDSNGVLLWRKNLFSAPYEDIAIIVKIKQPYLFIGGIADMDSTRQLADLLLLTCTMQGDTVDLQWIYQWGGSFGGYEELDGIEIDSTGIYISGWTQTDTAETMVDMVIQKLDFNGNLMWNTTWGTPTGFEGANGHMVIDNASIYISAHYNVWPGSALLISFDKDSGNYQWHTTWDAAPSNPLLYDDFYGLTMSTDSFLYATGPCNALIESQQALVKYDRTGQKIWERKWGGEKTELGRAIINDGDSIIYVAANTFSYGAGNLDIALLKYDSGGNLLDSVIWGTTTRDNVHDIAIYGNYLYLVGEMGIYPQNNYWGNDAFLLKVDKRTLQFPDTIPDNLMVTKTENFSNNKVDVMIFPNPFHTTTTIRFTLLQPSTILMKIFDVSAREVKAINAGQMNKGVHSIHLNGKDFLPGIYFYQLISENKIFATGKLMITH